MPSLADVVEAVAMGGTGMGLVFLSLFIFMFLMMGLTRLFPGEKPKETTPEPKSEDGLQAERRLAAAIALGLALALQAKNIQRRRPAIAGGRTSAWRLQGRADAMGSRDTER